MVSVTATNPSPPSPFLATSTASASNNQDGTNSNFFLGLDPSVQAALSGNSAAAVSSTNVPAPVSTADGSSGGTVTGNGWRADRIDWRFQRQADRIERGVKNGYISSTEQATDTAADQAIAAQMQQFESQNGGKLTLAEVKQLNGELNQNSVQIRTQVESPTQVQNRLDNQASRIAKGVADGKISSTEAAADTQADTNIAQELAQYQAGGSSSADTLRDMNKQLNAESKQIRDQVKGITTAAA